VENLPIGSLDGTPRSDRFYRGVITGGRGVLRALRLTVRSAGQEHVPVSGPVVLACNHVSFPDFVFVQQALLGREGATRRLVRFMCRHEIWDSRVGWALTYLTQAGLAARPIRGQVAITDEGRAALASHPAYRRY